MGSLGRAAGAGSAGWGCSEVPPPTLGTPPGPKATLLSYKQPEVVLPGQAWAMHLKGAQKLGSHLSETPREGDHRTYHSPCISDGTRESCGESHWETRVNWASQAHRSPALGGPGPDSSAFRGSSSDQPVRVWKDEPQGGQTWDCFLFRATGHPRSAVAESSGHLTRACAVETQKQAGPAADGAFAAGTAGGPQKYSLGVGLARGPDVAEASRQWLWRPGRASRVEGFSAAPQGSQEAWHETQSRGHRSPGAWWDLPPACVF